MVPIRRLPQCPIVSPIHLSLTRFSPGLFVVLQEILYQPSFALIRLLKKILPFQSKTIFFFQLIAGRFWFFCLMYMCFLGCIFSAANMKLRIGLYLHICVAFYLASHQLMWHNKTIHDHGLKITSCCCFFGFRGN